LGYAKAYRVFNADQIDGENGGEKVGHGSGGMSPLRAA
jgi:antirestriction protein ArdC